MALPVDPIVVYAAAALLGLTLFWLRFRPAPAARGRAIREALAAGAWILDVREPDEFAHGHIPGARNLPIGRVLEELPAMKAHAPGVILYCASGLRSVQAAAVLGSKGVRVVDAGGMGSWPADLR